MARIVRSLQAAIHLQTRREKANTGNLTWDQPLSLIKQKAPAELRVIQKPTE